MKKKINYLIIFLLNIFISTIAANAQIVAFDSNRWEIQAQESAVKDYLGRQSLFLKGGFALVKDSQFTDGIIEYDIAFTPEPGFLGVVWRFQDDKNYEEFYVRPQKSGQIEATQYQPVFNDVEAWQLYYGEGYTSAVKYDFNQWIHVKIVVSGNYAEIYIKDMQTPALFVNDLKREIKIGKVGLRVSNSGQPAYFSNFSYTSMNNPPLKTTPKTSQKVPPEIVSSWMVSNSFDAKLVESNYQLTEKEKEKLKWTEVTTENTGVFNFARLQGVGEGSNTVFAKIQIKSDTEQVKKLKFGFSDAVKVYFNDRLIYGGNNRFRSMDQSFLGTIGLSDELYLPLKKGQNELWFAVTENFGGWGIKAMFENLNGLTLD